MQLFKCTLTPKWYTKQIIAELPRLQVINWLLRCCCQGEGESREEDNEGEGLYRLCLVRSWWSFLAPQEASAQDSVLNFFPLLLRLLHSLSAGADACSESGITLCSSPNCVDGVFCMEDCMDGEEPYKQNTLPVVLHSLTWRQETGSCSSPVQGFGASASFVPQFSYQPMGTGRPWVTARVLSSPWGLCKGLCRNDSCL